MANNSQTLIDEVRSFTNYTSDDIGDADMYGIYQVAKEELRSDLGSPSFEFFKDDNNSHAADRALFWLTCIGTKIHAGEIGNIDLQIGDVLEYRDSENEYNVWFDQFEKRLRAAESSLGVSGASTTQIERTGRGYDFRDSYL